MRAPGERRRAQAGKSGLRASSLDPDGRTDVEAPRSNRSQQSAGEGSIGGKPTAFFDLFRVENGKLAEHWDTVATIPDRSTWKNANGKF
jgi:hypothetical protein